MAQAYLLSARQVHTLLSEMAYALLLSALTLLPTYLHKLPAIIVLMKSHTAPPV